MLRTSCRLSTVKDPEVNTDPNNPSAFIPIIYKQPNILTSRGTTTFSYDTRNASIDPTSGRELSVAIAVAGLLATFAPISRRFLTRSSSRAPQEVAAAGGLRFPHHRGYGGKFRHH